jgi:hypothetical protein
MRVETASSATPAQLLQMSSGIVVQQALYAAAKLGLADLLNDRGRAVSDLAALMNVNAPALLRLLRLLASQGVFEETAPGTFSHTDLSHFLRTGVPGSVRALLVFRGSEFCFAPFGEILYTQPLRLSAFRNRLVPS